MSYWPPEKQPEKCTYSYDDDKAICGEACVIIEINGLDEEAMVSAWKKEIAENFHDTDHNCCTVASAILFEGWSNVSGFWTGVKRAWRVFTNLEDTLQAMWDNAKGESFVWCPKKIERLATYMQRITTE